MPVKETGRVENLVSQRQGWWRLRPRASVEEEDPCLISSPLTSGEPFLSLCSSHQAENVAALPLLHWSPISNLSNFPASVFTTFFFFREASSGTSEFLLQSTWCLCSICCRSVAERLSDSSFTRQWMWSVNISLPGLRRALAPLIRFADLCSPFVLYYLLLCKLN